MNKRQILKGLASTFVAIPTVGFSTYIIKRKDPDEFLLSALKEQLPYLKVSDADYLRFITDIKLEVLKVQQLSREQQIAANVVVSFDDWLLLYQPYKESREWVIDKLARHFLLSTDFFLNGSDTQPNVNYIAWHNPSKQICTHPFANFNT